MSTNLEGDKGTCDKCGVKLPAVGVAYAVIVTGMDESGEQVQLHFCTFGDKPCAPRVFTRVALAARVASKATPEPPAWWRHPTA